MARNGVSAIEMDKVILRWLLVSEELCLFQFQYAFNVKPYTNANMNKVLFPSILAFTRDIWI